MEDQPADVYVAARTALLDALQALAPHQRAIILVGAQAVYLRTDTAVVGVAPYTQDADLAIDPSYLGEVPAIETVLSAAGFTRAKDAQPGSFTRSVLLGEREYPITVDLLVPEAVAAGSGRRSVELPGHSRMVARRTLGLEAALCDHGPLTVAALDENDQRHFQVEVAGPGALLVAKLQKLSERADAPRTDRLRDKDAGDIYRLFQATSVPDMLRALRLAMAADVSRATTTAALQHLRTLFGRRRALGIEMAARSMGVGEEGEAALAIVCMSYAEQILAELTE